jgi:hypothetical protein
LILAVLAFDKSGGLAEKLGMVLAVQGHGDLCRIGKARKFDFEVEPGADQNIGSVDRIDGLRKTGRTDHRNRDASRGGEESAHAILQSFGQSHLLVLHDGWVTTAHHAGATHGRWRDRISCQG